MADLWRSNAMHLRERWEQLPPARRRAYGISAAISVLAAAAILAWAMQPRFTPLYTRLTPEDAGAIVERLKSDKISYRVADGGATIEVPASQVHEVRMRLATAGLPQSSGPGWELFDKTSFGMTEFAQKLNYQRALQGELARTIMQLSPVENARVHLAIPEESLYEEERREPTASVVLTLKGAQPLSREEVQGILHLVSHAVPGMKPEQVAVMDSRGNVLSADAAAEDGIAPGQAEAQLQLQMQVERRVQEKVQAMLDRALGPGQAVVRVAARMDLRQRETNVETYSPAGSGAKGVLSEEHTVEEGYSNRPGASGQAPGLDANAGGLPGLVAYRSPAGAAGGNYTHKESTSRYQVSKRTERTVVRPGETTRLSVSVMVNGRLDPAKRDALTELVSAAAGIDVARGDQVAVVGIPFDAKADAQQQKQLAEARRQEMLAMGLRYGLAGLLVLFLLLIVRQMARRPVFTPLPAPLRGTGGELAPGEPVGALGSGLDEVEQTEAAPTPPLGRGEAPVASLPTGLPLEEHVRRVARDDPEFVARLLRTWLVDHR